MHAKNRMSAGNGLFFATLMAIAPICGCDSLGQVGDFIGGIPFADPDGEDPETNDPARPAFLPEESSLIYDITVQGSATGTTRALFSRDAVISVQPAISVATENGVNPIEVLLVAGQPLSIHEAGAIQFATNTALLVSSDVLASVDVSFITIVDAQSAISLQPADDALAVLTSQNFFTAEDDPQADVFLITGGQIILEFSDEGKKISGVIQVEGTEHLSFAPGASYFANFGGSLRE